MPDLDAIRRDAEALPAVKAAASADPWKNRAAYDYLERTLETPIEQHCLDLLDLLLRDRAHLALVLAEVEKLQKWEAAQELRADGAERDLGQALAEVAKGRKFKEFVHSYLTQHGVPEGDTTNQHQIEGCRIGARLDILLRDRAHLALVLAEVERLRAELDRAESPIRCSYILIGSRCKLNWGHLGRHDC